MGRSKRPVEAGSAGIPGEHHLRRRHGRPPAGRPTAKRSCEGYHYRSLVRSRHAHRRKGKLGKVHLLGGVDPNPHVRGRPRYHQGRQRLRPAGQHAGHLSHPGGTGGHGSARTTGGRIPGCPAQGSEIRQTRPAGHFQLSAHSRGAHRALAVCF